MILRFFLTLSLFAWTAMASVAHLKKKEVALNSTCDVDECWRDGEVKSVVVKTKTINNANTKVYYRIPKNYNKKRKEQYRVLVYFGGRNTTGEKEANNYLGWGDWCDENDIFLVCPGFKDDNYWQPEEWSGQALMRVLSEIKKEYNICTSKLLYYGYSAGSQASNLFPAWRPDCCRAWVSHACGVFHKPNAKMKNIPGLVTCGDADMHRIIISQKFINEAKSQGIDLVWKVYPNHPHDVPPDSLHLARIFLLHYHQAFLSDLTGKVNCVKINEAKFIGNNQTKRFYSADSTRAKNILPENRVPLQSRKIADAWGVYGE